MCEIFSFYKKLTDQIKFFSPCSIQKVYKPAQGFFRGILHAEYRAATDVYALMFLTDVIDFIIIVFGFWAFGVSEGQKSVQLIDFSVLVLTANNNFGCIHLSASLDICCRWMDFKNITFYGALWFISFKNIFVMQYLSKPTYT